jgi:tetratricopeptide (TPR) repeat protein
MKHRSEKSIGILLAGVFLGLFVTQLSAEQSILVVHVKDVQGHAVEGAEVGTEGSGGSAYTLRGGIARIQLANDAQPGSWVSLQVISSPKGRDLVLVSPWDGRFPVPPFQNESSNFVEVVVSERGDRAALESGAVIEAVAARINKRIASTQNRQGSTKEQRAAALAEVASDFGVTSNAVDSAIRAWGEKVTDPYKKGLAALYEKNYPAATAELRESLRVRESALARSKIEVVDAAFFLGNSLYDQGEYRDSAQAFQKAVDLRPEDPGLLNNLALSLFMIGDYERAEHLYRTALEISEKAFGPEYVKNAIILNSLAMLLVKEGHYREAEPLLQRALSMQEKVFGRDHVDVAITLNNLGTLFEAEEKYSDAESLFRQVLSTRERVFGTNSPDVATALNNVGELLLREGKYEEAEPLFRRALQIDEKALGPSHPDLAVDLNNLGMVLVHRNQTEAEALLRRALLIRQKAFGADHLDVAISLSNLATLLRSERRYTEAETFYRRALSIKEKVLSPDHPSLAISLCNLAGVLEDERDYEEAEALYRRALAIDEMKFGTQHVEVANDLVNLAGILAARSKDVEAQQVLVRAMAIYEMALEANDPRIENVHRNIEYLRKRARPQGMHVPGEGEFIDPGK